MNSAVLEGTMSYKSIRLFSALNIERIYTFYLADYDSQFKFSGEAHDMWEIVCVRNGNMGITSGTEIYDCTKDELVIHPPGAFHKAWAKGGSVTILTISFSGTRTERFVPKGKFILTESERMIVELIEKNTARGTDGIAIERKYEIEQVIKNLLECLCLSLNMRKNENAAPDRYGGAAVFAETVGYLTKNVERALTIEIICRECAIGKTALKELFNKYAGIGVIKYYNILRVRRAAELIAEGCSMAQIAEIMHFSSQNYFSAFFKRETGVAPSRYLKDE